MHIGIEIYSLTDGSRVQTASVPMQDVTTVATTSYFSTTFEVTSAWIDAQIIIKCTNRSTGGYASIDNVMLEAGSKSSKFSGISYGGFDNDVTSQDGVINARSYYWSCASGTSLAYGTGDNAIFGSSLKLSGNPAAARYAKQRAYSISAADKTKYDNGTYRSQKLAYALSGFGKADKAFKSGSGAFSLRADVAYYQGAGTTSKVITYYFDFRPNCETWQFVSGVFTTEYEANDGFDYSCVEYIDIYCDYSYQPSGNAYFDNISLVRCEDTTANYVYDEDGRLVSSRQGEYIEEYQYDTNRNVTEVADNRGNVTEYTYNANNMVVTATLFDASFEVGDYVIPKNRTTYTYNAYGMTLSESIVEMEQNAEQGNIEVDISSKPIIAKYEYNVGADSKIFGTLKSEYVGGRTTLYFYDEADGKLLASINKEDGTGTVYEYHNVGDRLKQVYPATYNATSGTYTAVTDAEQIYYGYNSQGALSTISTESTTYNLTYDVFGKSTSVKVGNDNLASYEYNDNNGKLIKVTYGNGDVEEYVYDHLENLIEVWYTVNGHRSRYYQYTYNADGSLYKFHDYISRRFTIYEYDEAGRLSGISDYNEDFVTDKSFEIDAEYDKRGQLTKLIRKFSSAYGAGTQTTLQYLYYYDTEDKLVAEFLSAAAYMRDFYYTYDGFGRLSSVSTENPQDDERIQTSAEYIYRTFTNNGDTYTDGLVYQYKSTVGTNEVVYTYTYDSMGNITGIGASGHIGNYTVNYHYDNLGQLIREDNGALNKTYVYTYDNAGNILYKYTYALTAANVTPTSPISTNTYTYGNSTWGDQLTAYNGNAITYDEIGNPLTYYNGLVFNWSGRQLITTTIDGEYSFFKYDDTGRRTMKGVGLVYTYYHYDEDRLVAEYWDDCAIVYIYNAMDSTPIGFTYRSDSEHNAQDWDVYWYEKNLQGDIVAIYDDYGTKLISYKYDAWGNFSTTYHNGGASTTATHNRLTYRGYYYDIDLGFYCTGTRYYDPIIGRFISPDDANYLGANHDFGSHNLYAYCSNNPTMLVDHTGKFPWLILAVFAVAGIIGGVLGYNSNEKIGSTTESEDDNSHSIISESENKELTTGDRIINATVGAGLGIASAGVGLVLIGTGVGLYAGYAAATVEIFGITAAQTVALGALAYNVLPILIAPFFGLEIEPMEIE